MSFSLSLSRRYWAHPVWWPRKRKRGFLSCLNAGAALEFAIIAPVLLAMIMGIITYGGYFFTAHNVQQLANDAARAAIAGLDDNERAMLVHDCIDTSLAAQPSMRGRLSGVQIVRSGETLSVSVTYDASEDVYWAFAALTPVPSPRISRTATIRLGGA